MKQIALSYKKGITDSGIVLKDKPLEQLRHAILQVFDSWYSEQAEIYRHQMHLSDKWGTAVIVQAMVFGNLNEHSGSGVIFTREPKSSSSDVTLYGDFIFGVQGDDIVSGLVETFRVYEPLRRSPELFGRVRVGDYGTDISWTDEIDMAADTLWRLAQEQSGQTMSPDAFKHWRERKAYTLDAAAHALGLSRRMVAYYEQGAKPIPRVVALATHALDTGF